MNVENEPVAWMVENDGDISFILNGKGFAKPDDSWKSVTPVYTHPVKELTYEDGIEECAQRAESYAYMSPNFTALVEELRAVLRKAQEK